jgi:hypothetical protein
MQGERKRALFPESHLGLASIRDIRKEGIKKIIIKKTSKTRNMQSDYGEK